MSNTHPAPLAAEAEVTEGKCRLLIQQRQEIRNRAASAGVAATDAHGNLEIP